MRISGKKIYYSSDQIRQVFITCPDLIIIETKKEMKEENLKKGKRTREERKKLREKIVIQRLPDHQTKAGCCYMLRFSLPLHFLNSSLQTSSFICPLTSLDFCCFRNRIIDDVKEREKQKMRERREKKLKERNMLHPKEDIFWNIFFNEYELVLLLIGVTFSKSSSHFPSALHSVDTLILSLSSRTHFSSFHLRLYCLLLFPPTLFSTIFSIINWLTGTPHLHENSKFLRMKKLANILSLPLKKLSSE